MLFLWKTQGEVNLSTMKSCLCRLQILTVEKWFEAVEWMVILNTGRTVVRCEPNCKSLIYRERFFVANGTEVNVYMRMLKIEDDE